MDEFPLKMCSSRYAAPQQPSASSSGCFDCNICLDYAVDPVVTLCGHLYCWPCIYKWLQMEDRVSHQVCLCPVCKATLSQDSLVPLYGRGTPAKRHHQAVAVNVPRRPPVHHHHRHHHLHDHSHGGELLSSSLPPPMMSSAAVGLLGEMVVGVLPWVFRNHQVGAAVAAGGLYYSRPYQQAGGSSPRLRRQVMQVERWLNQIWVFLFCCALFCLLLF